MNACVVQWADYKDGDIACNFFRRPEGPASEAAWRADVALLVEQHRMLRAAVTSLHSVDLLTTSKGSRNTNLTLVRGIAAHDLYHAGQIQMLKRLAR
jgi:hypothetical protein